MVGCAPMLRMIAAIAATLWIGTWSMLAQPLGRWVTGKNAPLPTPAEEYTAAVSAGRLYLIGGNGGTQAVLEYDPAADRWTTKKKVPFAGDHMTAAALAGKIYVFGGQGEGQGAGVQKPF